MTYLIGGIQQVGIGVRDVDQAWRWYRRHFGMDVPIFQDADEAPLMTRYTGGVVHRRTATLALNLHGGSGFEIWQYTSRTPQPPPFEVHLGDLGLTAVRMGSWDVATTHRAFQQDGLDLQTDVAATPAGTPHFMLSDPDGLLFDVVPRTHHFARGTPATSGPCGALIGVSDIDRARTLYSDLLGYDAVAYDETGRFDDWAMLPGGEGRFRRVLLTRSTPCRGPFARLFGPSQIELVQTLDRTPRRIFKDRFWGDLGFIHLCFDVQGMDALKQACHSAGYPFTVDSDDSFDMGEAAGRFGYIEDPDGTLIEFVETHRMPIWKTIGWYLNLRKRPHGKALPDWMLKLLALNRVKE